MRPHLLIAAVLLTTATAAAAQEIRPPEAVTTPAAVYPPGHLDGATVTIEVVVGADGQVGTAQVVQSGGPDFDAAALQAVVGWQFRAASRDGQPVAAKIRVPFEFSPPVAPEVEKSQAAEPNGSEVAGDPNGPQEVDVRGHQAVVQRGGSDFHIEIGQLAVVSGQSAADLLQLAPGIFIGNEGGSGHADQVFLRGFDAEQGQAIEFTVNGVPINEVDNPDGHGYADTHFIIPELVRNLRVVEGPFDPHQGDFAAAGSVDYELGVAQRGLRLEGWLGSWGSKRLLTVYAPPGERDGTFAAAQLWTSDGFGTNRTNSNASGMAQYEGEVGQRGLWRLLLTSYATHYKSAGVVRQEDVQSGALGYYGTEDPSEGGDAQRHSISLDLENPTGQGVLRAQTFLVYRNLRILEDFTGFLLDVQQAGQSLHPQRGDGILQSYTALTAGTRSSYRLRGTLLGQEQTIELGFYARYDHATPQIDRVRFGTAIPYLTNEALTTDIFNIAAFLDLDLNPLDWLSLRGGLRTEFFDYNVNNRCATAGNYTREQPLDQACPAYDRSGAREPAQRATATGVLLEPKVTAIARLGRGLAVTGSFGVGAQSLDAIYISAEENAPFARLTAAEGGALYHDRVDGWDLSGRAVGFYTHVSQDLIFDPDLGRLSEAPGTTRSGFVLAARATSRAWDEMASVTYARATYDDTRELVPYVPIVIARSDTVFTMPLPALRLLDAPFVGTLGLGINVIGVRPLPLGQASVPTLELDGTANLRWRLLTLGVRVSNIVGTQYPLSQFFYASDFKSRLYPTLVPAAHFTAAAPRTVLVTLSVLFDEAT